MKKVVPFLLVLSATLLQADMIELSPVEDVYITTGINVTYNPFLKFDISSVPSGNIIDSVFLSAYIFAFTPGTWDGNVNYWNLNNQTWTENDSAEFIWYSPTSDSTYQDSGFEPDTTPWTPGWARSVDLKNIFLRDYTSGNPFCTIKMKDPDDPNQDPKETIDNDTLLLGAVPYRGFYPHENVTFTPTLTVYYSVAGVKEKNKNETKLNVSPNPFRKTIVIMWSAGFNRGSTELKIYNAMGFIVRRFSLPVVRSSVPTFLVWDGTDISGNQVPGGVYFICLPGETVKIIKL